MASLYLFDEPLHASKNWLPRDGVVNYYGKIFSLEQSHFYCNQLLQNIDWQQDELIMFGKKIITKRKVAWYGDKPFQYTYSKTTKSALPWSVELVQLKNSIEIVSGETFNSCLLNLYHDGSEGMSWHSDDEKMLKKDAAIASLSFGAERKFVLRHKNTDDKVSLLLENGSLLLMKSTTQAYWQHQLPPSRRIAAPRINLTFRTISELPQ